MSKSKVLQNHSSQLSTGFEKEFQVGVIKLCVGSKQVCSVIELVKGAEYFLPGG